MKCIFCGCRGFPACSVAVNPHRHVSQSTYEHYLSSELLPIKAAQSLLETIHTTTGLPWWATIAVTTIGLRAMLTLPLMSMQFQNAAKRELLRPTLNERAKELAKEVAMAKQQFGWNNKIAEHHFHYNMQQQMTKEFEKNNCHPYKEFILPWIQIPTWIFMSLALRNMSGTFVVTGKKLPVLCPDLATEGMLWFPNLLLPDTTFILPVLMCVANLIIIEMHYVQVVNPVLRTRIITYVMRSFCLVMLPVGAAVPTCLSFYWTCSSLFGLLQNILLRLPRVRRALFIPKAPNESVTPLRDLWTKVLTHYRLRPNKE